MKKILCLFLFLLIVPLSGCAVKEVLPLECVNDSHTPPAIPAFYVAADIPQGTFLTDSCKEGCCALYTHEDYEVMQEIFRAESLDDAFVYLTGKTEDDLKPLKVSTLPKEEYRFAWSAAGENGELSCSGLLYSDGIYYYSLCIFCQADAEKTHHQDFSRIFSGTELLPV